MQKPRGRALMSACSLRWFDKDVFALVYSPDWVAEIAILVGAGRGRLAVLLCHVGPALQSRHACFKHISHDNAFLHLAVRI